MRRKSKVLSILFSIALLFTVPILSPKLTAHATDRTHTYTISADATNYSIVHTDSKGTNEPVTGTFTTLESALEEIEEVADPLKETHVAFNNITLSNDLTVSYTWAKFSGSIVLGEYSIICAPTENITFALSDITLESSGTQSPVLLNGTSAISLTLSNCTFSSPNAEHAINITNESVNLTLENNVIHSSDFIYNYISSTTVMIDASLNSEEPDTTKVVIPIPYNADGLMVISNCQAPTSKLQFEALASFYTCSIKSITGNQIQIETAIKTSFDANGGTLSADYTTTALPYNSSSAIAFPTASDLTYVNHSFKGFLGTIVVDDTTYYFDKTAITSFAATDYDETEIANHFFTEIADDGEYTYFTRYKNGSYPDSASVSAINYFISKNQSATFIADWAERQYVLSFESNEGSTVDPISGLMGTAITLPTPTKAGYTFNGWFDQTLENQYTFTTMPSEDLTLYASWTINKHTLTLVLNNTQSNIVVNDIDYGTTLSTITALSTVPTKTGHTFNGWFANEGLTNAFTLTTMPDENVTVYADWNINIHTLTMHYNNSFKPLVFHSQDYIYGYDISSLASEIASVDGFSFMGWFLDDQGRTPFTAPITMPDADLDIYGYWIPLTYTLTFYFNNTVYGTKNGLNVGNVINTYVPENPTQSGFSFKGWFKDPEFTQPFDVDTEQTMPASNLNLYAKMVEKATVIVELAQQTFEKTKFSKFNLFANTGNITVEYLVGSGWTTEAPTEIGTYDIKITRAEDETYKEYSAIIKDGLVITADSLDVSWIYICLYAIFFVEIITTLFVMVLKKRKQALTPFAVALPFGVISTSQFVNIIISAVLAIGGFVFLCISLVQLHRVNIYEDTRTADEKQAELNSRIKDVSTNETVSQNVDELLKKEGFIDEE